MINNEEFKEYYEYSVETGDLNFCLSQMLEDLKWKDEKFISSLNVPLDLDNCTQDELRFLTIVSAVIDYKLQEHKLEVPRWLRDNRLVFDKPYYHSKRLTDFEKVKLIYTSTGPFRARNVYFELSGLERV